VSGFEKRTTQSTITAIETSSDSTVRIPPAMTSPRPRPEVVSEFGVVSDMGSSFAW
jgi:hypothetical protein